MHTTPIIEAQQRMAELREHWLSKPENYPPPRGSHHDLIHAHRNKWLASAEYAHGHNLMREAIEQQTEHNTDHANSNPTNQTAA